MVYCFDNRYFTANHQLSDNDDDVDKQHVGTLSMRKSFQRDTYLYIPKIFFLCKSCSFDNSYHLCHRQHNRVCVARIRSSRTKLNSAHTENHIDCFFFLYSNVQRRMCQQIIFVDKIQIVKYLTPFDGVK